VTSPGKLVGARFFGNSGPDGPGNLYYWTARRSKKGVGLGRSGFAGITGSGLTGGRAHEGSSGIANGDL